MTGKNYDVFLSHSVKDDEFVRRLARDLVKAGFSVWVDLSHIMPGESFAQAIDASMRASRFVVVVMSPNYFQSAWTNHEYQSALAQELQMKANSVRVIPLLYRDCDIPPMLRTKVWVDFTDDHRYELVLGDLVRDLRSLIADKTPVRGETEEPKPGERIDQLDAKMVSDLKKVLQDAVEAFRAKPDTPAAVTGAVDLADIDEDMCFIIMPFGVESLGIVYEDFVKPDSDRPVQAPS